MITKMEPIDKPPEDVPGFGLSLQPSGQQHGDLKVIS